MADLSPRLAAIASRLVSPEVEGIRFGEFRLKLHERKPDAPLSPYFFNLRTPDNPRPGKLDVKMVRQVGRAMLDLLDDEGELFDLVAGVPNAGDPFAAYIAHRDLADVVPLQKVEQAGKRRVVLDPDFKVDDGVTAVVVDDLVTEADSKLEAIEALRSIGIMVRRVIVLIDREQGGREQLERVGCTLHAVFTVTQLLDYYLESGAIDRTKYLQAMDYLAAERDAALALAKP